ncbi:transport protein Avl9-domain-containing protein [Talaromyces proteolyticus]|uniref:Transport protein Avl9-domain-containing protein n=1 Tax=Talaromyces proteolyticus TaxID=1131652 RepID=A0AAD4KSK5_9EURO|nr:transport protein Avl9-domain-containing protein [Talaromyces proteolyticus]KAH8698446.1 transport protein Avl9-domain-containing protein [Talaromyces proteolyticus]
MADSVVHQDPIVLVIDFHHARGPEIELCFAEDGTNPAVENDWSLLPFMALSDGAHASTEDFSYFTLRREATSTQPATSLFGISCTRQISASELINRSPDVTRSTVQKAVVVVTDRPQHFGTLREKLSMVTLAWFEQRDFADIDILKKFRESLIAGLKNDEAEKDAYLGLSLREMTHQFKSQTLVLFKGLLLQPKMLFFGSRCERLCMMQFSLLSLLPGLINNLQDCADPAFDSYSEKAEKPSSLKTSERSSLLAYMGLPLQIFGKGSIFGPYTPLQQLDLLADHGTKSYVVGSTNSLLLQQKDRYSDILINLDEGTVNVTSPSLRTALALTAADRRWIDFLVQIINETWDESHPGQPKTHGYVGSEEFIRLQFEEYLLALLSCMNHRQHVGPSYPSRTNESKNKAQSADIEGDPSIEFNTEFIAQWQETPNYALFHRLTSDALLFSIVEPRHPCAGGLTVEDIQRRLAQQVSELHLDERVREGREALNKTFATGQKKVSSAFNSFWADIEALREAQRKRNEERAVERPSEEKTSSTASTSSASTTTLAATPATSSWFANRRGPSVDLSQAQTTVNAAGQKAGAYFSSWGTWASERRKEWQDKRSASSTSAASDPSSLTSPSTQTLPSVSEKLEALDRGRRESLPLQRKSEDSSSSTLGRSMSRRKRWSTVLRKKDRSDSVSPSRADSLDVQNDLPSSLPKSPLGQVESPFKDGVDDKDDGKTGVKPDGKPEVLNTEKLSTNNDSKVAENDSTESSPKDEKSKTSTDGPAERTESKESTEEDREAPGEPAPISEADTKTLS